MQEINLLDSYKSISHLTGRMVCAAEAGDWNGLVELERDCRNQVETLKLMKEATKMEPTDKKEKVEVLKKILADDARIRELTEPWMRNLHAILSASHNKKRVNDAYKSGRQED